MPLKIVCACVILWLNTSVVFEYQSCVYSGTAGLDSVVRPTDVAKT